MIKLRWIVVASLTSFLGLACEPGAVTVEPDDVGAVQDGGGEGGDAAEDSEDVGGEPADVADVTDGEDAGQPPVVSPGFYRESIEHGGMTRTFSYFVPSTYEGALASPVLFVFHGGGPGGGEGMRSLGFEEEAASRRTVVVYPDGYEGQWNDGRGTTQPALDGVDDVGFVDALIDWLGAQLTVDEAAIFATGVSNGGMFSHRLACELSHSVRGVAPVIAALPTLLLEDCAAEEAMVMVAIQGTEDPFIPIDGGDTRHQRFSNLGDGGDVESAQETMAFWAQEWGCDLPGTVEELAVVDAEDPTRVTRHEVRGCAEGARIDYYVVEGMGHTWPPNEAAAPAISGASSSQMNARDVIWEFFLP